jgi:hypothetical protein
MADCFKGLHCWHEQRVDKVNPFRLYCCNCGELSLGIEILKEKGQTIMCSPEQMQKLKDELGVK